MLTAITNVMTEMYDRNWITTRDGNISLCRKDEDVIYITPSGYRKNVLRVEDIQKMPRNGLNPEGIDSLGPHPSIEYEMHYLLQKDWNKTRSVVHGHPTHVIAAMFAGFDLQKVCSSFPEIFRYTRVGETVPFFDAGSEDLANKVYENFVPTGQGSLSFDIVGLKNHGVTAIGVSPWDAFEHIERLEHICKIVLASGVKPDEIGK
jgi:L-fuculose-phosphate aldolase